MTPTQYRGLNNDPVKGCLGPRSNFSIEGPFQAMQPTRTKGHSLAVILCLVMLVLLSCQASPLSPNRQTISLTFACPQGDVPAYRAAAMLFRQDHPEVDIQVVSAATLTSARPEIEGDALDYALHLTQQADMFLAHGAAVELGPSGVIRDLTPYVLETGGVAANNYPTSLTRYFQEQGKTWGAPAGITPFILVFRPADLSAVGGLEPSEQWTWDDLRVLANKLTIRAGVQVRRYGFADHHASSLRALLVARGLTSGSEPGATAPLMLNDMRVVEAVQWYTDLALMDHVMPNASTDPAFDSWNMFNRSEAAMAVLPLTRWLQVSPQARAGVRVMALPEVTPVEPLGYFISARAQNPQMAWRFIEFIQRRVVPVGALSPGRTHLSGTAESDLDQNSRELLLRALERPALPFRPARVNDALRDAVRRVWAGGVVETELTRAQQEIATMDRVAQRETFLLPGKTPTAPNGERITFLVQDETPYRPLVQTFQDTTRIGVNLLTVMDFMAITPASQGMQVQPLALADLIDSSNADCFEGPGWYHLDEIAAVSLDLRPLLDSDGGLPVEDFYSQAARRLTAEGHVWGLPIGMKVPVLQYNQDLFDITNTAYPSTAWTWLDVFTTARQLSTGAGPTRRYGFVVWPGLRLVGQVQRMAGVSWIDLEALPHTVRFNAPQIIFAAETLAGLVRDGVVPTIRGSDTPETMLIDSIYSGKIAMWPAESQDFRYLPFRSGVAQLPGESFCCPVGSTCTIETLHISAQTAHVQACWKWLRFLAEQPATNAFFFIPPRRSVMASAAFGQQVGLEAQAVYLAAAECKPDEPGAGWDALPKGASNTLTLLATTLEQIVWYGADAKSSLDQVQEKADAYVACLRRCVDAEGDTCLNRCTQ